MPFYSVLYPDIVCCYYFLSHFSRFINKKIIMNKNISIYEKGRVGDEARCIIKSLLRSKPYTDAGAVHLFVVCPNGTLSKGLMKGVVRNFQHFCMKNLKGSLTSKIKIFRHPYFRHEIFIQKNLFV